MLKKYKRLRNTGFTLIETLIVLGIVGFLAGIAAPSLFQFNKPLKTATLAFNSHISLIRAKAIATGQAYRLVMKYPVLGGYAPVEDPKLSYLQVEYAPTCMSTIWKPANGLDLQLPDRVQVIQHNAMNLGDICFDKSGSTSLGILYQHAASASTCTMYLRDFNANSTANLARVKLFLGGRSEIITYNYNSFPTRIPADTNGNAVF